MPDLSRAVWRTSVRSGNGNNCVEVADNLVDELDVVLVRDSKDRNGPVLSFTRAEWTAFIGGAAAGEFDL